MNDIAKLLDNPAFADGAALDRLRMCANCRVVALTELAEDSFAGAPRTLPRTTEEYLRERDEEDDDSE